MTELNIEIISKSEMPFIVRQGHEWIYGFLEKLNALAEGDALKITMPTSEDAKKLQSTLFYFKNRRHRIANPWNLPLKQCQIAKRGNRVFVFKANKHQA